MDRFSFEIVAETEVSEPPQNKHSKECVVVGSASDVVDVASAETLLASGRPCEFQFHASETMLIEWGDL